MTSYVERYRQGEHALVWRELVALGDKVRAEPLHSDARAVAQETMRRVRHNLELIHSRLEKIGYEFHSPSDSISPPNAEQVSEIDEFEREVGPLPLSLRAWVEVVGAVNFMGTYPKLSYCEKQYNPFLGAQAAIMHDGRAQTMDIASLIPTQSELDSIPPEFDDALSSIRGALANLLGEALPTADEMKKDFPEESHADLQQLANLGQTVRSNMRRAFADATNASQSDDEHSIPEEDRVLSDPLVVQLDGLSAEQYEAWQEDFGDEKELEDEEFSFSIYIAPDINEKANQAGDLPYQADLPDSAADFLVHNTEGGDTLFVEYLRSSLEWAGFRELRNYARRDEALLESLKEGLLPF